MSTNYQLVKNGGRYLARSGSVLVNIVSAIPLAFDHKVVVYRTLVNANTDVPVAEDIFVGEATALTATTFQFTDTLPDYSVYFPAGLEVTYYVKELDAYDVELRESPSFTVTVDDDQDYAPSGVLSEDNCISMYEFWMLNPNTLVPIISTGVTMSTTVTIDLDDPVDKFYFIQVYTTRTIHGQLLTWYPLSVTVTDSFPVDFWTIVATDLGTLVRDPEDDLLVSPRASSLATPAFTGSGEIDILFDEYISSYVGFTSSTARTVVTSDQAGSAFVGPVTLSYQLNFS